MKSLKLFFLAIACLFAMAATAQSKAQMNAQKLGTTLYLIENFYVDTANLDKVTEDAIIAALKELDPHSAYISKKDVEKANEPLVGSFEGIGVTFQLIRDTITVISPTAGGPSEKVGIMAGDQFIKIDGEESVGKKVDNEYVQKHLRGKKGTKVTVSVKRGNDPELLDFEITRDKIPLNSINAAYMLDNHVGYIKLDRFAQESNQEFMEAFVKLQAYQNELEETLDGMMTEYNNKVNEFQRKSNEWAPVVLETKQREIQELGQRIQQFQQNAQQEMAQMQQTLMSPVIEKAQNAITKIAKATTWSMSSTCRPDRSSTTMTA